MAAAMRGVSRECPKELTPAPAERRRSTMSTCPAREAITKGLSEYPCSASTLAPMASSRSTTSLTPLDDERTAVLRLSLVVLAVDKVEVNVVEALEEEEEEEEAGR